MFDDPDSLILPTIELSQNDKGDNEARLVFTLDSINVRSLMKLEPRLRFEHVYDIVVNDNEDIPPSTQLMELALVEATNVLKIDIRKLRKSKKDAELQAPDIYNTSIHLFLEGVNRKLILERVPDARNEEICLENVPFLFSEVMLQPLETS